MNETINQNVQTMQKAPNLNDIKNSLIKEYGEKGKDLRVVKIKGGASIQTPGGVELERYNHVPKVGYYLAG